MAFKQAIPIPYPSPRYRDTSHLIKTGNSHIPTVILSMSWFLRNFILMALQLFPIRPNLEYNLALTQIDTAGEPRRSHSKAVVC